MRNIFPLEQLLFINEIHLLTDYLPITFSCFKNKGSNRGRGFWKFHNILTENEEYVLQMKTYFRYFK